MKYFVSGNCYVSGNSGYSFWLSDIVEVEKKIETSEELRELERDIQKVNLIEKFTIVNFKEIV